ncbi:MAG: right-handed parallel beta-helix repeat-containing protein [Promethearchaeota archaeon]
MKVKNRFLIAIIIIEVVFPLIGTIDLLFSSSKIEFFSKSENNIEEKIISGASWTLIASQIHIDDSDPSYNWNTTATINDWCTGNGSWSNPYIIQNLIVDGNGSGTCIEIRNSNTNFIIKNCTVYNSGSSLGDAGINMFNVTNGKLINNNFSYNGGSGIGLFASSDNNTISGNVASNNLDYGIWLSNSNNNTVSGNNLNYNQAAGMYLWDGTGNNIIRNNANHNDYDGFSFTNGNYNNLSENNANYNIRQGIVLWDLYNNFIIRNNASGNVLNGLRLYISSNNTISENNLQSNELHGIFFTESHDNNIIKNKISYNKKNGMCLFDSDNNILNGNNVYKNRLGIGIYYCGNYLLSENIVNHNRDSGVYLLWSDNNKLIENKIFNNSFGIYFYHSSYNYLSNNDLRNIEKDIEEIFCEGNIIKIGNYSFEITFILALITFIIILTEMLIGKKKKSREKDIIATDQSTELYPLKIKSKKIKQEIKEKEAVLTKRVITVEDLKKFFGNVKALNGISFNVHQGEIFGLLGPNGAGKTTTIKLLLRILEPEEGKISLFGLNPEIDEIRIKKRIGYVSEEPFIFKALTPKELFNFVASIRELDEIETTKVAKDYLECLEATEIYEQLIDGLSHGNKQKLQIIAAILHKPDLLILDEPLAGLDVKSVKVVKTILKLHTQRGGSILFSTHILEVAQDLCDRIGIINKGKIVGIGTLEELRQQTNRFGASLEDVYLRLTEQDESVNGIVEKLRKSFKKIN